MKKKFTWGMILLTVLFVAYQGWQASQAPLPVSEQNMIVPTLIALNAALPEGVATPAIILTVWPTPNATRMAESRNEALYGEQDPMIISAMWILLILAMGIPIVLK